MTYDATRFSGEFRINTTTTNNQFDVELSALESGGFVAVWTSQGNSIAGRSVMAQMYDADMLPLGDEFAIQAEDSTNYVSPVVAGLEDGGFAVFWASNSAIEGRRYDATGTEIETNVVQSIVLVDEPGFEFYFSDVMGTGGFFGNYLSGLDIVATSDGGYTIGGNYIFRNELLNDILYYHYDADHPEGTPGNPWSGLGAFVAPGGKNIASDNGLRQDNQDQLDMASLTNGTMVSVWRNDSLGDPAIYARIVDDDSVARPGFASSAFQVNTTTSGNPSDPVVTALTGGGFVVTWHAGTDADGNADIKSQLFTASGAPSGPELTVNTITAGAQAFCDVAALADGGYVVTWQSFETFGNTWGIYARRFDAQGEPLDTPFFGGQFKVDSYGNRNQTDPSIVATEDGGFTIAWTSEFQDGSGTGVYAQRYLPEFHGTRFADTLTDTGADLLYGYGGADVIRGGDGNDRAYGGLGNDLMFGGDGKDRLFGDNGQDTLRGGNSADRLSGGNGRDSLIGGNGNDRLAGGSGMDMLFGGNGADRLNGGAGFDTLTGGNNADTFLFSDGADVITDFTLGEDVLQAAQANASAVVIDGDTHVTDAGSGHTLILQDVIASVGDLDFV